MPVHGDIPTRTERIELRATPEEKRLLAAAALHERLDVTTFVLRAALPAAQAIVTEAERLRLSHRDMMFVLDMLEHPPAPTASLRAAAEAYRQRRLPGVGARPGKPKPEKKRQTRKQP